MHNKIDTLLGFLIKIKVILFINFYVFYQAQYLLYLEMWHRHFSEINGFLIVSAIVYDSFIFSSFVSIFFILSISSPFSIFKS